MESNYTTLSEAWPVTPSGNHSNANHMSDAYRFSLLSVYSLVLVGGVISMSLMINILQSNVRSFTTTAVINLIVVHSIFLLTIPFRIYFYISQEWRLGQGLCRVVSGMIFAHIYLAFVFYVIILVIRYLAFHNRAIRMEFYRTLHAVGASAAVWLLVLLVAVPVSIMEYGSPDTFNATRHRNLCFCFGGELRNQGVAVFNYILSGVIIGITVALTCCQMWILSRVYQKYQRLTFSHQEFWAQVKSLCFVLVMVVCFMPYHVFRIYYVQGMKDQARLNELVNELFLAMTSLSCLDMLTFIGRGSNRPCYPGCCTFS